MATEKGPKKQESSMSCLTRKMGKNAVTGELLIDSDLQIASSVLGQYCGENLIKHLLISSCLNRLSIFYAKCSDDCPTHCIAYD